VRREKYAASEVERCGKVTGFDAAETPKEALERLLPNSPKHLSLLTNHVSLLTHKLALCCNAPAGMILAPPTSNSYE
jgi:hypothetical protein